MQRRWLAGACRHIRSNIPHCACVCVTETMTVHAQVCIQSASVLYRKYFNKDISIIVVDLEQ